MIRTRGSGNTSSANLPPMSTWQPISVPPLQRSGAFQGRSRFDSRQQKKQVEWCETRCRLVERQGSATKRNLSN